MSRLAALAGVLLSFAILSAPGNGRPAPCTERVEAFFWTGTADRERLARALAASRSPCADYWLSIAPLAADKKRLRVQEDDRLRALGITPVAEFTIGERTGWANWVNEPGSRRTWFDAGVAFRVAMADAGYDVTAGETWMINEFDRTTTRNARRGSPDHDWPPARRAAMRELMRGLYHGAPGMPKARGIAELGIHFRHQNIPNVARYRSDLESWLADTPFWIDANRYLRWLAVETYPDSRLWAPPGSSLSARARHLEEYVFHVLDLARASPRSAPTTRRFFERAYLPLLNGGWRARGGEQFRFVGGHGNTILDDTGMRRFVSEQVHAVRRYARAHRGSAPAARLGFSWQPCNRNSLTEAECRPADAGFRTSLDLIATRMAAAIRYAYGNGRNTEHGACRSPGDRTNWCRGRVAGARFTDAWSSFARRG